MSRSFMLFACFALAGVGCRAELEPPDARPGGKADDSADDGALVLYTNTALEAPRASALDPRTVGVEIVLVNRSERTMSLAPAKFTLTMADGGKVTGQALSQTAPFLVMTPCSDATPAAGGQSVLCGVGFSISEGRVPVEISYQSAEAPVNLVAAEVAPAPAPDPDPSSGGSSGGGSNPNDPPLICGGADYATDEANCGACDAACGNAGTCINGACLGNHYSLGQGPASCHSICTEMDGRVALAAFAQTVGPCGQLPIPTGLPVFPGMNLAPGFIFPCPAVTLRCDCGPPQH